MGAFVAVSVRKKLKRPLTAQPQQTAQRKSKTPRQTLVKLLHNGLTSALVLRPVPQPARRRCVRASRLKPQQITQPPHAVRPVTPHTPDVVLVVAAQTSVHGGGRGLRAQDAAPVYGRASVVVAAPLKAQKAAGVAFIIRPTVFSAMEQTHVVVAVITPVIRILGTPRVVCPRYVPEKQP